MRPENYLMEHMNPAKNYRIGVDIGGTKIAAVLLDHKNRVLEDLTLATPKDSLEHFLIMLQAAIDPLIVRVEKSKGKLIGIGIGVPGVVDASAGQVILAPNAPLLNKVKLVEELSNRLKQPDLGIILDNDTNCFVRAEAMIGAGSKSTNVYGLIIGTGIGGGWWHNNEIYLGQHGASSEPGHMIIDVDNQVTLEQVYHKLTQNNPALLAEEAYRGDPLAGQSFEEFGNYLGIALSTIVNLLDPAMIVIGGGAIASSELFLKSAKDTMKKHTFSEQSRSTKLVKSKLGKQAGAIGAGLLIK